MMNTDEILCQWSQNSMYRIIYGLLWVTIFGHKCGVIHQHFSKNNTVMSL